MDVLIHLHIAKTGGTSLNSMIKHGFRPDRIQELTHPTPGAMTQAPLDKLPPLRDVDYISGHVPLSIQRIYPNARFITTIRNPIDRIISFFHFQDEDQGRYGMSFEDYVLQSYDVQLHNYQTRVLCGLPDVETVGRNQHPAVIRLNDSHLAEAKANIEKSFLIAPIERLTDLGLIVRKLYGWPIRRIQAERRNPTASKPPTISPQLYRQLQDLNLYDLALHEWVTSRFVTAPLYDRFMYALTNSALCTAGRIVPWGIKKRLAQSLLYKN